MTATHNLSVKGTFGTVSKSAGVSVVVQARSHTSRIAFTRS